MRNAAKRFVTSTDRSNRQLLVGLPIPSGHDSGAVTADVDGGSDFERWIICTTKIDEHLQRHTIFLPVHEGLWHIYLLRAGRSNVGMLPSGCNRAMGLVPKANPTCFVLCFQRKRPPPFPTRPC